jgi:hypothetical protein
VEKKINGFDAKETGDEMIPFATIEAIRNVSDTFTCTRGFSLS